MGRLLILLLCVLSAVCCCSALHVALVTIPLYGHFLPMKAIGEQLILRGHKVTAFVENVEWCQSALPQGLAFDCHLLPRSETFPRSLFEQFSKVDDTSSSFTALFYEIMKHQDLTLKSFLEHFASVHQSQPFDAVFTDQSTFVGFDAAAKYNLPCIGNLPFTLSASMGWRGSSSSPRLGTGYPRQMSLFQRFHTFVIDLSLGLIGGAMRSKIGAVRVREGISRPYVDFGDVGGLYHITLTPTIWGYDVAQAICPNFIPLGHVAPLPSPIDELEIEVKSLLDRSQCQQALYVNFGTLAVLSESVIGYLERAFERLLAERPGLCLLWKTSKEAKVALSRFEDRIVIAKRFASPKAIMRHPKMKVFLTHCGDTSVGEAIDAELPLTGLPMFADQPDVCQRMQEAGIGIYAGPKTMIDEARIVEAVGTVLTNHHQYLKAIKELKQLSATFGGSLRGAETIEQTVLHNITHGMFSCRYLNPNLWFDDDSWNKEPTLWQSVLFGARTIELDSLIISAILVWIIWSILAALFRRVTRRKS